MLIESPEAFCYSGRTEALLKKNKEKQTRVQSADLIFEIKNTAIALDLHDFSNKVLNIVRITIVSIMQLHKVSYSFLVLFI